ncbi:hypothetical protein AU381_25860 [Sinorhizobium glycinis]|uniref:Secreted protein n=1 Tax=Sinorhizobium glycinis TaxID=1472378 RepID=A0A178XIW8_9HYPH|nr:hypothetical protein [Sinorhizobium glycinis]OAP35177.1 hypothetical protein AU381_25860 [Sinorhizobium glycinis]
MRVLRTACRLIRIAVLCVMVLNLHGTALADYVGASHDCPTISEADHGTPISLQPGTCCTKTQCCPIAAEPLRENRRAKVRIATPHLNEPTAFLLVRTIHHPPKLQLS